MTSLLTLMLAALLAGALAGGVARRLGAAGRPGLWLAGMALLMVGVALSLTWVGSAWPVWLWLELPPTRWPWLGPTGVMLAGVSLAVAACLTMSVGVLDRMVRHGSAEALRWAWRHAWLAGLTLVLAGALWRGPSVWVRGWSALPGAVLAGTLLMTLVVMLAGQAALIGAAMTTPVGPRRRRWMTVATLGAVAMPLVAMMVLVMTLVTAGAAGQGVEVLLGYDPRTEPSLADLGVRWVWLSLAVMGMMAMGVAVSLRLVAEPGRAASRASADTAGQQTPPVGQSQTAHHTTRVMQPRQTSSIASSISAAMASAQPGDRPIIAGQPHEPAEGVQASPVAAAQEHMAQTPEASSTPTATSSAGLASVEQAPAGAFPTRLHFAVMAILAAGFVFYASLVPVQYRALSWDQAVERFSNVHLYKLGIDRRADLVANLVVLVPVTFLAMGALHTAARRGWRRWASDASDALLVAGVAFVYVVAIEFTQEWFPPRTVSQNDMHAGWAGSAAGIILWLLLGRELTAMVRWAVARRGSALAVNSVLAIHALAVMVYATFPMDFTFDPATLAAKRDQGRMDWLLGATLATHGLGQTLWMACKQMLLFVPVGWLMARLAARRAGAGHAARTMGLALAGGVALAVVMELIRLPVFSAYSGSVHLLGRVAGVVVGVWSARFVFDPLGRLALGRRWSDSGRARLGLAGGVAMAMLAGAALLYPFEFAQDAALFRAKMSHFWNWPFQLYYYAGEWFALSKVVQCAILFSFTGMLMRWGLGGRPGLGLAVLLTVVLAVGLAVEVAQAASGQRVVHTLTLDQGLPMAAHEQAIDITDDTVSKGMVFSIGKVADVTDLLVYLFGAWAGWVMAAMLLPDRSRGHDDEASPASVSGGPGRPGEAAQARDVAVDPPPGP